MTDHAELSPRSFFNADDLSLLIMEHPDAPQFLAVKIADAHDAALAALVAERDALRDELKCIEDNLSDYIERKGTVDVSIALAYEVTRAALAQGGGE